MKYFFSLLLLCAAFLMTGAEWKRSDFKFTFKTDKPDALYKVGETVRFSGNLLVKGKVPENMTVLCQVIEDGFRPLVSQKIKITEKPIEFSARFTRPGWIRLQVYVLNDKGKALRITTPNSSFSISGGIGAMAEPEKILPGGKEPADFNAFWAARRAELNKVPVKAERVPFKLKWGSDHYNCWDIKVDCAGGAPVSGYLCIPRNAKPQSCPALVRYHGAGVRSANPVAAYKGLITLDVNAHGIENGKDPLFYRHLQKTLLKGYHLRGQDDRNACYFTGMYLRVMRALDYVKTLPEWDGKTLIVFGGSQGGAQSLAAAALDQDVTHCIAGVPALCDHSGVLAGRVSGWPRFIRLPKDQYTPEEQKILQEMAYVDCAFMARRIKAVTFVGTGFMDTTCAPTSVFAAYNSLPAKTEKYITLTPEAGHNAPNTRGMKWLRDVSVKANQALEKNNGFNNI